MTQENTNGDTRSAAPSAQDRPQIPQHEVSIADLSKKILATDKQYDLSKILSAYQLAEKAHADQKRSSGEPYIIHPLAVADILLDLGMDTDTICVGLLHDVVEDTNYTLDDIRKKFGQDVAMLVDGVTKLNRIPIFDKEQQQAENVRKILLAMSHDIRVMIIKLADRIHNMRTLKFLPPEKQRRIALETMNVYAPIAHRLGIRTVKEELEDLSFYYLDSYAYSEIEHIMEIKKDEREKFIDSIKERIRKRLEKEHFAKEPIIEGRVKSIYGIYKKVYVNHKSMDEIYDKYAVRVIVSTVAECYMVLGIVHDMFRPLPNRFKDYISTPKSNMYQSLHTTVLGRESIPFEIQIRTWDMHRTAEYGIAAHWKYKLGKGGKDSIDNRLEWIHKMLETGEASTSAEDLVRNIKGDLSSDEIFVFTPNGDIKTLPSGATVIDFAYAIHSAVGNRMTGAKVNGKIVPITYKLKTGEICEVLTSNQPGKGPSRDWLKVVTTGEARSKIRSWFKKERRDENIVQGKAEVDRELRRNFIRLDGEQYDAFLQRIAERQHCASVEDFYATVGYGGLVISRMMPGIKDEYNRNWRQAEESAQPAKAPERPRKSGGSSGGVIVEGIDNCLINMARCCAPVPGEEIIGFITRGHGLTIHRRDCVNVPRDLAECPEPERWVKARWDDSVQVETMSTLEVYAIDRDGLVLDIANAMSKAHVKIQSINARPINEGNCLTTLTLSVNSREHLENVVKILKKIPSVYHIERGAGR